MTGVMTGLTAEASNVLDVADIAMVVDVSDTTMAGTGTNKKIRMDALFSSTPFTVGVNAILGSQAGALAPNTTNTTTSETGVNRDAADTGSGNLIFTVKRLAGLPTIPVWSNSTAYQIGDMVSFSSGWFACSIANTGTSPIAATTSNTWRYLGPTSGTSPFSWPIVKGTGLLVLTSTRGVSSATSPAFNNIMSTQLLTRIDPGSLPAPWSAATAYVTNALVQNAGYIYKALQNNTNQTPPAAGGSNTNWQGSSTMPVQILGSATTVLNFDPHTAAYPVALQAFAYQMVDTDPAASAGPSEPGRAVFGADLKARIADSVTRTHWQINGFETGGSDDSQQHSVNGGNGVHIVNQGANDIAHGLWVGSATWAGNFRSAITVPIQTRTASAMPQYQGAWVSGTTYHVHDLVQDNSAGGAGNYYVCAPWGSQTGAYVASMVSTVAPHSVVDHTWVRWLPGSGPRDYVLWYGPVGTVAVDGVSIPGTITTGTATFYINSGGDVQCQNFGANGATPQGKQAAAADVAGVNTILRNLGFVT